MMKCPKCHSKSFDLNETFEETEIREVRDGVLSKERIDHLPGSILGYSCECACGHQWAPRRATVESLEREE